MTTKAAIKNRLVEHEQLVDKLSADTAKLREEAARTKSELVERANGSYKRMMEARNGGGGAWRPRQGSMNNGSTSNGSGESHE